MVSLKEARAKRDELAMMVFHGESPLRQKQLEKLAVGNTSTVHDFCERYFKEVIQKDRKDPTQLRRYLDKEIYPALGSHPMKEVTAQDVQSLVFLKRNHGFESSAAQLRNLLKRIFDYAIVCGLVRLCDRLRIGHCKPCACHPNAFHYASPFTRRSENLPRRVLSIEYSAAV